MKLRKLILLLFLLAPLMAFAKPRFNALVFYENGGNHTAYSARARAWLDTLADRENFQITYVQDTRKFTEAFLNQYQLIIQLDYVPYGWKPEEMKAFKAYLEEGKGGWIGFHHATLLGDFDGFKNWDWFSEFMGGIKFKSYIASFAAATVKIELPQHPVFKGIPPSFFIAKEEWYTYDKSPRPNVTVLASVDEQTYQPSSTITMGDHPVIWTNNKIKSKNIYIFMGHTPLLFDNEAYKQLFKNAIFWAVGGES